MEDFINQIKHRAGIPLTEGAGSDETYTLHQYNTGNARPFVMEGTPEMILQELAERLDKGDFHKIELISPFV